MLSAWLLNLREPIDYALRPFLFVDTSLQSPQQNIRAAISSTIHSTPSTSPSPVNAEQALITQCRVVILSSSRKTRISSADSAPARSCLFANTSKDAPANRSSCSRFCNSRLRSRYVFCN
eukprot:GEMP01086892.1.p1 GENE.GEMP01086892.1~~GEMP01086892.1.p1  ORF type:complete len:120 (-),score=13.98 GEMP01086892.1:66-425(-)